MNPFESNEITMEITVEIKKVFFFFFFKPLYYALAPDLRKNRTDTSIIPGSGVPHLPGLFFSIKIFV